MSANSSSSSQLELSVGGYSCAGNKAENEDAFAAHIPQHSELITKGAVVALADGVSGAEYAAQAAQLSVTQFIQEYYATPDTWSTKHSAAKVLTSLNQWLYCQTSTLNLNSAVSRASAQWLTTFSALIVKAATGYLFHIGDSRISCYRDQQFSQITRAHHCRHGTGKTVLTRALGADTHVEFDVHQLALRNGDLYLLSSDGVHDVLAHQQLAALLAELPITPTAQQLELCSKRIIEQAFANGSDDNLSCVLLSVRQIPNLSQDEMTELLLTKVIPPALKVGAMLDDYQVLNILHASARSHLYLAKHPAQKLPVVLKIPSINFSDDAIYLQGFAREAWLAQRIKHPNILQISRATNSRFVYHICEYIEGQTLSAWMTAHPTPELHQVKQIIVQIVAALRVFQRLELVHRDLKPDNIMIDPYGQIKLIDFGTVWIAALDEQPTIAETVPQGSLNYLAPETLLTMASSHQSDLFSLAVICYQMLSGQLPYAPMKRVSVPFTHYQQWHYRSLKLYRPDLPVWLDLALQRATKADPKSRHQAYAEFITDLTQPNLSALALYQQQPILARDPVQFWQMLCLVLWLALIVHCLV